MSEQLNELRQTIDGCDAAWVAVLGERFAATRQVGRVKAENGIDAVDMAREAEQFARIEELACEAGVPVRLARAMLRLLIDEVVLQHQEARLV